ncbi:phytoene/squalene synthase family protein [Streptomyces hoynatensis]|uniref:Phytoene/squalene synthase family protein n=1 Tax=Streptomyces hoynatensis TaxID=1141874 RepID=A0A3A9YSG4_9ACTN|nr:phytoene/squalene synthase family protein [Streptomyces hoynatensis]RKN38988.1 phytoene/squalene synthase family protein [Streptomyces hoynatensis]
MSARELDAAGITAPSLRADYAVSRRLHAAHGRTYFLATRLLPPGRRPAVHALYGFARRADEIVDAPGPRARKAARAAALTTLERRLAAALAEGPGEEPAVRALVHTVRVHGIDPSYFAAFLASMRMDLEVTGYADYAELSRYMHGSAAVIGLQLLPVLGTVTDPAEAAPYAAALGIAFQLTNFVRDLGEDLDRDRVYLPADLLAAHGVDRGLLVHSRRTGRGDPRITAALRAAVALTRAVYREAEPGIALLDPASRPCVRTAFTLYGAILERIEAEGYATVHRRAVVPRGRRAAVALGGMAAAARVRARRPGAPARRATPGAPA